MGSVRYPWDPLEPYVGSDNDAASLLRVARRTVLRYKAEGLTLDQAERAADAVGEHPFILWPEMRDELIAEPAERRRRYQREYWRRRWERMTDEEREAKRAYTREYRRQSKQAIAANRRRYYRENRDKELARQREYDRRKRSESAA